MYRYGYGVVYDGHAHFIWGRNLVQPDYIDRCAHSWCVPMGIDGLEFV